MLVFLQKLFRQYYWLAAPSASLVIVVLSSIQNPPQPDLNLPFFDKIAHTIIYTFLGFAYLCTFTKGFSRCFPKRIIAAFFTACCFGAFDEFYQSFIPNRFPELGDWIADILGISCGFLFYFWVSKKRNR